MSDEPASHPAQRHPRRGPPALLLLTLTFCLTGCTATLEWLGIRLLYEETAIESKRVIRDTPYLEGSELVKQRLDLFLPDGDGWPVLLFVHGGGWTAGDKELEVAGADVYGNIARFYAERGIGSVLVNYRLQPEVTWREQVEDVARAVAWVREHIGEQGGDADALFLSGHSAGAQLAAYVALRPEPLGELGLSPGILCGVIPVSGAAYDLADAETYELGAELPFYEERFRAGDPGDGWLHEASAVTDISPEAPPFLLIHGSREWKSLGHQNRLLDRELRAAGIPSRLLVARQSHRSIVLVLSREDRLPGAAMLDFIRAAECARRGGGGLSG